MKTSISIVIPIYNAEKTLQRCLDSVIASIVQAEEFHQDSFSGEIICVNDGSTDSSEAIITEYQKKYKSIKYIAKQNGGGSDARNKGIDAATGEYIMFCDSDDSYEVSCVKQIVDDIFEFSPYYICFGRTTVYLNGEKHRWSSKTGVHKLEFDGRGYINSYLPYNGHSLVVFNKVYKRQILDQYLIRFDTSLRFGEDVLFNLLYMRYANGPLIEDFRTSYLQYKTEGSLTTSKQIDFFDQNTKCMDVLRKTCSDWYEGIEQFACYYYIHSADLAVQRICSGRDAKCNEQGTNNLRKIQSNQELRKAVEKYDFSKNEYLKQKITLIVNGKFGAYKLRYITLPKIKRVIKHA